MEAQEEFIGSNVQTHQIVKRKRTKRQRSSSPNGVTAVTTSSSSSTGGGGGGAVVEEYGSITSPITSSDNNYESTEEEEDMANCLIMLAQGDFRPRKVVKDDRIRKEKFSARKFAEIAGVGTTTNKAGFYVYECKTCNRTFPSFQALGGHRASHRRPKPMVMEEKKESLMALPAVQEIDEESQFNKTIPTTAVSFQTTPNKVFHGNKGKIHECSICGSEFTSGQALGGHMRRHRANTSSSNNNNHQVVVGNNTIDDPIEVQPPARNILSLDLNLPAPEDDHQYHSTIESKFQFATSTQQPLVFSAPALVDCHY